MIEKEIIREMFGELDESDLRDLLMLIKFFHNMPLEDKISIMNEVLSEKDGDIVDKLPHIMNEVLPEGDSGIVDKLTHIISKKS